MVLTVLNPNDLNATTGADVVEYSLCSLSTTPSMRLFLKYWAEQYGSKERTEPGFTTEMDVRKLEERDGWK